MSPAEACLVYSGHRYFAQAANPAVSPLEDTPVTRLIETIWDHHRDHAFHLLRCRIFTNYPLTLRCRGAVQLAAKRVTVLSPAEYQSRFAPIESDVELPPPSAAFSAFAPPVGSDPVTLVEWMNAFQFQTSDRPILASLVDNEGRAIMAATNSSSSNRLRHAEVNLVRSYVQKHGRKIPEGYSIWVSLKPCRMCSGFIYELSEDGPTMNVHFIKDDPGPMARHSPLTNLKLVDPDQD